MNIIYTVYNIHSGGRTKQLSFINAGISCEANGICMCARARQIDSTRHCTYIGLEGAVGHGYRLYRAERDKRTSFRTAVEIYFIGMLRGVNEKYPL